MIRRIVAYALLLATLAAVLLGVAYEPVASIAFGGFLAYVFVAATLTRVGASRLNSRIRAVATAFSAGILAVWALSLMVYVRIPYSSARAWAVGEGAFIHHSGVDFDGGPLRTRARWEPSDRVWELGNTITMMSWSGGRVGIVEYYPVWPFAIALTLPTAALWIMRRRRFAAGHCQICGYDLTGNVSGVCPECGAEVGQGRGGRGGGSRSG